MYSVALYNQDKKARRLACTAGRSEGKVASTTATLGRARREGDYHPTAKNKRTKSFAGTRAFCLSNAFGTQIKKVGLAHEWVFACRECEEHVFRRSR